MDILRFTNLMNSKEHISKDNTLDLEKISQKYPYFQAGKSIYLKALKQNNNFKYNKELKATAAITVDRSVLFDYISDFDFSSSENIFKKDIEISTETTVSKIKETSEIGKPLEFQKNESHSFNEWLQLSSKEPIVRKQEQNSNSSLFKNIDLIDQFIEKNPTIKPLNKDGNNISQTQSFFLEKELMTQTLAKVYLEQKKYNKAIKAYEILILKYPEKSGFFADQINKIEYLKNK